MKKIAIVEFHSFVDLITNSSSELFVCDTEKSLKAVKEIIEKIISNYYDEMGQDIPNSNTIWTNIFIEPYVIKKDFDLSTYPNQDDVNKVSDWDYYDDQRIEIDRKLRLQFPYPDSQYEKTTWQEKQDNPIYKEYDEKYTKARIEAHQVIWKDRDAARDRIKKYFDLSKDNECFISYDIRVKKGNIILESADDNSIPYECWDRINTILHAVNYHLG